jgi:streptogramin lyase
VIRPDADASSALDSGGTDAAPTGHAADASATPDDAGIDQPSTDDAAPGSRHFERVGQFGSEHLSSPQHIAIDAVTGNLYVACFTGSVVVFDKDTHYLATYGTSGPGKLNQGVGVAVDPLGNVYVGDYGNHVVTEFDKDGAFKATFPAAAAGVTLGRVTGVLYTANRLYAVDDDGNRVLQFDANGAVVSQFATNIEGQAALAGSTGIAVDATGDFWISDYYYHSFAEYTSEGTFVAQHGSSGTDGGAAGFDMPYAINIGPSGKIYVADIGNHTVQRFTSTGAFEALVTDPATGADTGFAPSGVAVGADGRIYVSDSTNNVVDVYTP